MANACNITGREVVADGDIVEQEHADLVRCRQLASQSAHKERAFVLLERNAKHIVNGRNVGRSAHIEGNELDILVFRCILDA